MKNAITASYRRDSAPVEVLQDGHARLGRITCATCGALGEYVMSNHIPPEGVRRYFTNKGWVLSRRSACPECSVKKKEPKMASVTPIKQETVAPVASDVAKAKRRDAHTTIELYFDIPSGAYTGGYSDDLIAKETGLSVEWVSRRREEEFGPLKEPGEFKSLRAEIAALADQCGKLQAKIAEMAKANGWA